MGIGTLRRYHDRYSKTGPSAPTPEVKVEELVIDPPKEPEPPKPEEVEEENEEEEDSE